MRSRTLGLVAVACLLLAAVPAHAAVDPAAIAKALGSDPLYVDPAFEDAIRPSDLRRLRTALKTANEPVYLAVVPIVPGDRFDGEPRALLSALRGRLGRPGVYATYRDYLITASDDANLQQRASMAAYVASFEGPYREPIASELLRFVRALDDPRLNARYEAQQGEADRGPAARGASGDDDGGGVPLWLVIVAGAVVLAIAGGAIGRRRGARAAPEAPPLLPDRVFEHARRAQLHELRDRAEQEVIAFADAIDTAPDPSPGAAQAAYGRALDASSAATKLLEREPRTVELAGVLVLIDRGREQLRAAVDATAGRRHEASPPLCFFDPLHGRATGEARWTQRDVWCCDACARDLRAGRNPQVLREDGRPWFERDGALAATGLGHFSDDLASRLLRGDAP